MRVAAIDIGTNTARLLIVAQRDGEITEEVRLARVCGLGRGVDESGTISDAAIERTVAILQDYATFLDMVDAVRVVATSASRDAANRHQLFDAAQAVLGVRPELIDGSQEAALSFAGASAGRGTRGPRLVIDVGGGSTEFVMGDAEPEYAISVDVGSVRLTDRWLDARPVSATTLWAARDDVLRAVEPVRLPEEPTETLAVAGTFTSLAAIALELEPPARLHNSILARADVAALVAELATLSIAETAAIPSLDPRRAPVILGGAIVAEQIMTALELPQVTVSEHDLLDGVASGLLPE